ncbi:DNA internalization-related competence protein ComEC/Rec2 [Desulfococcus sp.]|uniref:DNA internalization-related competence protein ComEC/Rec2 n=1 Tax=Desulfococcus sp. TaxID=2025834 RepID=UPI003594598A
MGERFPGGGAYAWGAAGICLLWLIRDVAAVGPGLFSPLLLFLLLGYLSIQQWVSPHFPSSHIVHQADLTHECIQARLLTWPETRGSRISFIAAVESLGEEGKAAAGRIRVSVGTGDAMLLRQGDAVRFSGRIRRIRSFRNPGGFDYGRFMAFQEIHCATYVRKGSLAVLTPEGWERPRPLPKGSLSAALASPAGSALRSGIHARMGEACPGDAGAVLSALLIGDTSGIGPRLREQFNRAGISHLLAISGLHIGMILALFYGAFMRLFAFVPPLLWHGWQRKSAAMASLIPVLAYATLAQWPPSTQRAVCMAGAVCLALWFGRPSDGENNIALAALAVLVVFPPALFAISFQLSFAAVIAIIPGMRAVSRQAPSDEARFGRLKEKAAAFMAVSLLAILGTLPLTMYYFNQASFIGVLANLFYIPLVGCLVLPIGLLSVFLFPVSMDLCGYGLQVSGALLDAGLKVLPLFSELPFGYFRTVTPTVFEIGLYYAAGWAFLVFLSQKRSRAIRPEGAGKRAAIVWGLLLIAGLGDALYWTHDRFFREDLRVTLIDVGQGGSALVEFPAGYRMLIDGGGYYDRDGFDVGARVVAPFLRRRKILTLDAVVLTHPDSDHLNGLFAIVAEFRVKTIWTSGAEGDGDHFRDFMKLVEARGIPAPAFDDLPRQHRINGVDMEILYPPPGFALEDDALRDREKWRGKANNRSLVIAVRSGRVGILFTGDIEKAAELDLVKMWGDRLHHRVLVAPHHGSRTSSSTPFLECVRPEVVMVSAGWDNRFRCPHPEVLARYRSVGARVLRTDIDGALVLQTDGRRLLVGPAAP